MEPKVNVLLAVLGGIIIISLAMSMRSCGRPDTPEYFDRKLSLEAATEQAQRDDLYILALFTADWCPPCAQLKKGALASGNIASWISDYAVPVYIDVSNARTGDLEQQVLLTRHRVQELPTILLFRGGQELGRVSGNIPGRELNRWLRTFSDAE